MNQKTTIVFIINLLQDLNILRPLVYIARRDLKKEIVFLVTPFFLKRDKHGIWEQELNAIVIDLNAEIKSYDHEYELVYFLQNKSGLMISASESDLNAHKPVHDIFKIFSAQFLKITLQHGFECVGFLQSKDQDMAHGKFVSFGADIICGWCEKERLTSILPSQISKLFVTGPTAILQSQFQKSQKLNMGIVCENMHSPRLNTAGNFKVEFINIFAEFCKKLESDKRKVTLRPHPGGQYMLKNKIDFADNVIIENSPIYRVDLKNYDYGISAPSSILIDMILAKIPVAVWQDESSVMDLGNYEGLVKIGNLREWVQFSKDAVERPEYFLKKQESFLKKQKMIVAPEKVYENYFNLLNLKPKQTFLQRSDFPKERVLYIANAFIPTLQLSFYKPLASLVDSGEIITALMTEEEIKKKAWLKENFQNVEDWITSKMELFNPTIVVFCRYSGPYYKFMLHMVNKIGAASIYHIDDDLLNIPKEIGIDKYKFHNSNERLNSVKFLMDNVDLVYCSTLKLKNHLEGLGVNNAISYGNIYCSSKVINKAQIKKVKKIGYMGIGHENDMKTVIPALVKYMETYPDVVFELFGSIPIPKEFDKYQDRVYKKPQIFNYNEFLNTFAEFQWDIGICPLENIKFNMVKANTKWVEYTTVGAAVVASKDTVYDECCSDDCGILAETEDDWYNALVQLTENEEYRFQQVENAQKKLTNEYSVEELRRQVLNIFKEAKIIKSQQIIKESNEK